jgi:hypothetical protein
MHLFWRIALKSGIVFPLHLNLLLTISQFKLLQQMAHTIETAVDQKML